MKNAQPLNIAELSAVAGGRWVTVREHSKCELTDMGDGVRAQRCTSGVLQVWVD